MAPSEYVYAVAFVSLIVFLSYVLLIIVPFMRRREDEEGDESDFHWHVFVPCRDEETVINQTISALRDDFPAMHVWVIDDDSEDRTAELVERRMRQDDHVHLVPRRRPEARTGKGDALNAAYLALCGWLPLDAERDRVIVAVVDADGRLAPNALRQAAGPRAFADKRTGAAQIQVRMSNRDDWKPIKRKGVGAVHQAFGRYLVRMQDIEFRTTIAAIQELRRETLSVGLGGNGQFTRLSALDAIAGFASAPWHGALLEDYELGVHVMLGGYRTVYLHDTYVEQEGLPGLRRLTTQRVRWCQGGMQCTRYLPAVLTSPSFSFAGVIETCYFLLSPFLELLGVIVWPLVLVLTLVGASMTPGGLGSWLADSWWIAPLLLLTGIMPFAIWPLIYSRQEEPHPIGATLGWALGYWAYQYLNYVVVIRAFLRLVRGRNTWAKTRRNAESQRPRLVASEI